MKEPPAGSTNTSEDSGGTYKSRRLDEEELWRLGIVRGPNGLYYKTSEGRGGTIVFTPVDPAVVQSAARAGVELNDAISQSAINEHQSTIQAITRCGSTPFFRHFSVS